MSYVEKHLIEGEAVVYKTRLHWIVLVVPVLVGLLIGLPGLALLARFSTGPTSNSVTSESMMVAGATLLVFALVCIGLGILSRNATEMTVTNKRVVAKVGVFARRTIEMLLSRVESIGVEETVMGRMLGYGKVIVRGTGGTPESFDRIAGPLEFRTQVQQQIEKSQERTRS
jgi:uncharacterized membrane protein YdbT with pleckstrin-like domain